MKKSHRFDDRSNVKCKTRGCRTRIKTRLIEKQDMDGVEKKFELCYRCFKKADFVRRSIGTKR